jgi:hypothetical protein
MDLSDLNDCGYDQQSLGSPESTNTSITPPPAAATEVQGSTHSESQDLPVRIRKKPGRKPNPASPALRKAQNRAAQRAFRERKERHMKDLETSIRGIKSQRDKLLQENEKMASENEILKSENWYLKGIVLSLQLVCFQHKLVIPQHCPHVNEQTLSVLAQSIPESISSYLNVNAKSKLQMSQKLMDPSQQQQQQGLSSAPILITQDGVQAVQNKHARSPSGNNSWYHQQSNKTNQAPSHYGTPSTSSSSVQDEFSNIPPLSPMPTSDRPMSMPTSDRPMSMPPQPVMMANEPVTSNLAAIQTLRLRLRLQSACVRMQSMPFAIQPTLLQVLLDFNYY